MARATGQHMETPVGSGCCEFFFFFFFFFWGVLAKKTRMPYRPCFGGLLVVHLKNMTTAA